MAEAQALEQPATESDTSTAEDRFADLLMGGEQPEQGEDEQGQSAVEAGEEQTEEQGEEAAESAALEEVEFNGKQFKVPAELKSALMAQSDYTKKTQEIAAQKALLATHEMQLRHAAEFQKAVEPEVKALQQLEMEIARYKSVDWSSLDTEQYIRTKGVFDQLKDAKAEVEAKLGQKRGEFQQAMHNFMQEGVKKGNDYLAKFIPKWGAETGKALEEYSLNNGLTQADIAQFLTTKPDVLKALWKASQWDALQSQKPGVQKRAEKAPPVIKPGATPTASQQSDAALNKALRGAKTSQQKAKILGPKIADIFMR